MPRCSHPKCRVADTGVCLEGHKQGCPNLLPDEPTTVSGSGEPRTALPETRPFHSGAKITTHECSRMLNEKPARVVFCAGSQESGKTTFLARIGEMFRDGSFSRYRFAGSRTLCGFERATWLATIASGAGRPATKRTRRVENDTFLHLTVHPADEPTNHLELLISDLAGETFPTAVASREFCEGLHSLARADHLVTFMDCARLGDSVSRHAERDNARAFLQRVTSVKHDHEGLHVQVAFSRWDYALRHANPEAQQKYLAEIQEDLQQRFGSSFATLEFLRIAARPDDGIHRTDADIQAMLARWIEMRAPTLKHSAQRCQNPARDFSAFGLT